VTGDRAHGGLQVKVTHRSQKDHRAPHSPHPTQNSAPALAARSVRPIRDDGRAPRQVGHTRLTVANVDVRIHGTVLYNSIYRFDSEMIVNTHVYGKVASHAPALHLRRLSSGTLFDTYAESFTHVWDAAKPLGELG